ncbi:MAG: hypothetical protein JXR76_23300 [Deltaproteobacteria bacterium]|nr:hypothetical protein [Deltaproteobacteria bacterium]
MTHRFDHYKIMPIGDSITETTCFPNLLQQKLKDDGFFNFTFIGSTLNNQACDGASHVQTEGHGGWLVTSLLPKGANDGAAQGWIKDSGVNVALIHFATNDVWSSKSKDEILLAHTLLVNLLREETPNVVIFVAQIIPVNPSDCSQCLGNTLSFNAAVPAWADQMNTSESPVIVVDQFTGFDTASLTRDGVHPNVEGGKVMAQKWYDAMQVLNIPHK